MPADLGKPVSNFAAVTALCRFKNPGSSLIDTAIGLSFARRYPEDVRPDLALWFFACDDSKIELALTYAAHGIIVHAARTGIETDIDVFASATRHAVARSRRSNRQREELPSIEIMAKLARVRREVYADLVYAGQTRLMTGITDGLRNFLKACGYVDHAMTLATNDSEIGKLDERPRIARVVARRARTSRAGSLPRAA